MKVNNGFVLLLTMLSSLLFSCGDKEDRGQADRSMDHSDAIPGPGERVMINNGIRYAIRFVAEDKEPGEAAPVSRYMFVIGQRTDQGKNVLEYQADDHELYARRLNYYNIEIGNDIMLIACGDTLKPAQTIYENNLGVIPENRIVAVFEKEHPSCALQLVFNDRAFENYLIKASFNDK